ncbi:hypothetical protein ILYODFUR_035609 [Ilyodon furcidens]|uniref:Uncharacterized protein n=1 Tax=Ilyodon furcidens TaxID=33524 RepID=A0ABV0U278_9TELE
MCCGSKLISKWSQQSSFVMPRHVESCKKCLLCCKLELMLMEEIVLGELLCRAGETTGNSKIFDLLIRS